MVDIEKARAEFTEIYKANITRDGADKLLDYKRHIQWICLIP